MLKELRVANLALVEDLALSFGPGLTMITGETGAGKSLIAGALGLLTGGKSDKGQIREGEETAVVEAVFDLLDRPDARRAFADAGLRVGADGLLIMRRELKREGRGRVLINGLLSSLSIFERLGPLLLSVQSQDHQRLLTRPGFARDFLDRILGLESEREGMATALERFRTLEQDLADRLAERAFAQEQLEMWEYQLREISAAQLSLEEEENLAEKLAFGRNLRSLMEGLESGRQDLLDGEPSARQLLARTLAALEPLAGSSPRLEEILVMIRDAEALVTEAGGELQRFGDGVDVDPARLDEMEARQHLYTQLQRKYGRGVRDLLELQDKLEDRIARQKQSTSDIEALRQEVEAAREDLAAAALDLHRKRKKGAPRVAARAQEKIRPLALPDLGVEFRILPRVDDKGDAVVERKRCRIRNHGADAVSLHVRTNTGESWNPVGDVASGGEKSRIFLGLSVLETGKQAQPLQLFDEIDAGLGMDNAVPVARLLAELAGGGQVLCITHLPTVAAHGQDHLKVAKHVSGGRTSVSVRKLDGEARIEEVARLLGGETGSGGDRDAQRAYARQLLGKA